MDEQKLLYVGRTGDGSSPKASSSFSRVAHGPILAEATDWEGHVPRRDVVGGLEQRLEQELRQAGWDAMNTVRGSFELDEKMWVDIRPAFTEKFRI